MQIKQAAAKCGLTEKAIRLYEEKGLISPPMTEINGRMFRNYDEETVSRLQTISALRRAFFSIDQITEILDHPENIPAVFDILKKGSEAARAVAANTLNDVRSAMRINYFDDAELIAEQSRKFQG